MGIWWKLGCCFNSILASPGIRHLEVSIPLCISLLRKDTMRYFESFVVLLFLIESAVRGFRFLLLWWLYFVDCYVVAWTWRGCEFEELLWSGMEMCVCVDDCIWSSIGIWHSLNLALFFFLTYDDRINEICNPFFFLTLGDVFHCQQLWSRNWYLMRPMPQYMAECFVCVFSFIFFLMFGSNAFKNKWMIFIKAWWNE